MGKESLCDDAITEHHEWFRFAGDAGTRMPETCVSPGYCGAESPGWLNGKHPTEIGAPPVRSKICFYERDRCKGFCVEARVKLCGDLDTGYYVYKLRSVPRPKNGKCVRRYCGTKTGQTQRAPPPPPPPTSPQNRSDTARTPPTSPQNASHLCCHLT